ncbi:hypothetical protein ASG35_28630 [Burkholderia sp. Leaf177]|uniref:hypothetical protein n=1 Tax=Burkholderia sp. Leaf177 TaxID=1736287 RepID=UPI0006FC0929|nr:hypothetical protein [Burkholderia sp. Leaf177]KQR84499.1 hypothetical protein ASG35_28630 [Burkholderia sp. Leaf177]
MNAPLVVVQGDLLLPTLYPLAGMPNAIYGEEWTLTIARPALTEYEIPFYAARFLTAYISPLSLPNERFPYTPASLWGKFRRNDEMLQTAQHTLAAESFLAEPPAPEPAPFAFEPFTAPDDRMVRTQPAHDRRKQVAGGAIALACAAFIAWALFGTRIGHQNPEAQPAVVALKETPVNKPAAVAAAPSVTPSGSAAVAGASSASSSSSAQASAQPSVVASSKPSIVAAVASPPTVAASDSVTSSANATPQARTTTVASKATARAKSPVVQTKPQVVAQTTERERLKAHTKSKRSAVANREARSYEVAQRRHGHEYQGTPVYRSSGFDAPLASPGRRSQPRDDMRTGSSSSSGSSLSVAEMYNMLAHSAVLDDNSGATRQTVRATSLAAPRSGSGDSSNWSSDLNQRRVTDPGSQFLK